MDILFNILISKYIHLSSISGASRDRTDDPLLAKQVLSQLSYGPYKLMTSSPLPSWERVPAGRVRVTLPRRLWWAWVDLNYRPHAYQACALTN